MSASLNSALVWGHYATLVRVAEYQVVQSTQHLRLAPFEVSSKMIPEPEAPIEVNEWSSLSTSKAWAHDNIFLLLIAVLLVLTDRAKCY